MLTRALPMPEQAVGRLQGGRVSSQPRLNPAGERAEIRDSLEFIIG